MRKQFVQNNILFARYGTLSPVKHKKYFKNNLNNKQPDYEFWDKDLGFHSPPCKKGVYAFVYPYIEKFLLSAPTFSGLHSTHPKVEFVKDKQGKKFIFNHKIIYDKSDSVFNSFNLLSLKDQTQIECFKKQFNKEGFFFKDYFIAESENKEESYLVKRIKPKIFSYEGEIWHHLGDFLESRGSIIEQKGAWVKTDFLCYKKALKKALGQHTKTNYRPYSYSWDRLEVFIEKV